MGVIKRTKIHFLTVFLVALASLVNIVMIVILLPSVTELTSMHILTTALLVTLDGLVLEPMGTVGLLVLESFLQEKGSSEVLLVVGVHTGFPVVLHVEGAENCFVGQNVELLVLFQQVQQFNPEFEFCVDEGTVGPVLTLPQTPRVVGAESGFEPFLVVHLFRLVVCVPTKCVFTVLHLTFLGRVRAKSSLVLS